MRKVKIKRNIFGDTRTATSVPTFQIFCDSNRMHRDDVRNMMFELAAELKDRGADHDYTKYMNRIKACFIENCAQRLKGR